jgi:hypothetical protein
MKFEDQLEVCDALGCKVSDQTKRLYLMENLNTKFFEQTLLLWKSTLTRSSFPTTFAELKAHISNEYSNQMTDPERAKVILNVVGQGTKKSKEQELSLNTNDKDTKGKCFLCGRKNHKMKQCWYYDANKTLEQNKKIAEEKMKEKIEERKKKTEEKKKAESDKDKKEKDPSNVHKGTIVQLPTKTEKTGMCLMTQLDAQLYCEPCNLMGVGIDEVDFIYDTGTVSGVMGEKEKEILKSVEDEDVLIETVTGERSISKQHGDTIFGKTRILKGRQGSVLVSQFSSKNMYQVLNPDEDTFILRGWNHNPTTKGKVWYFSRDEERYGDKLLHCTVKVEQAKCFANREEKFYNPMVQPKLEEKAEQGIVEKVQAVHCRWNHASFDELNRLIKKMQVNLKVSLKRILYYGRRSKRISVLDVFKVQ